MSTSTGSCLDANVVIRIVKDPDAPGLLNLPAHKDLGRLFAPTLLKFELTNAFHRMVALDELSIDAATSLLQHAFSLPIEYVGDERQHILAMEFASRFKLPAAYDAHYLAVSELLNVEFWTADKRLYNSVHSQLPWVHLVD